MAVNDSFFSILQGYEGSVDDRRKERLIDVGGYSSLLSIQDMERAKLSSLGYTGSLNDMWSEYLVSLGGIGLESLSTLLTTTFYMPGIDYAVQSIIPTAIADYDGGYYQLSGAKSTFDAMFNPTDAIRDAIYNTSAISGAHEGLITYTDNGSAAEATFVDLKVDNNNRIIVKLDTAGAKTGTVKLQMINGGSLATATAVAELTPGTDVPYNIAWRVTSTEISISLNGAAAVTTATALGIPDLSTSSILDDGDITRELDRYWASDIGEAGIVEAST